MAGVVPYCPGCQRTWQAFAPVRKRGCAATPCPLPKLLRDSSRPVCAVGVSWPRVMRGCNGLVILGGNSVCDDVMTRHCEQMVHAERNRTVQELSPCYGECY